MRHLSALLVIATACHHGRVSVNASAVADKVYPLMTNGRVTVRGSAQRFSPNWSGKNVTIRRDQKVDVWLRGNTEYSKLTFGELLADCPDSTFLVDNATRLAYPKCKLLAMSDDTITVGRTRYPGPWFWGALGGGVGFGIVACAYKCDSPFSEVSTGAVIVGSVLAVGAIVLVAALLSGDR